MSILGTAFHMEYYHRFFPSNPCACNERDHECFTLFDNQVFGFLTSYLSSSLGEEK